MRRCKSKPRLRYLSSAIETASDVSEEPGIVILPPDLAEMKVMKKEYDVFLNDDFRLAEIAGDLEIHASELGGSEDETRENLQNLRWRKK